MNRATLLAAALFVGTGAAFGTAVPLGDFNGTHITYQSVTPDDGQPTIAIDWGTPILTGNQLDFDPSGYTAAGTNGTSQNVPAPIAFTLIAQPGVAIQSVSTFQSGVYSLAGTGAGGTSVLGGGIITGTVTEVDGAAIVPFVLSSVDGSFSDALPGGHTAAPWSVGLSMQIAAQLTLNTIPFTLGATRIDFVYTPTLDAKSEQGNSSSVSINDLKLNATTVGDPIGIPEPATFGLCFTGLLLALGASRKWRR